MDEAGASAIEFALLAPALVLACLATADIGLAVTQKMVIDQSLRAGAEGAMRDLGQEKVRELVSTAARKTTGIISTTTNAPSVSVARFCACPEDVSTSVSCATGVCSSSAKPAVIYRLSAAKAADTIMLPSFQVGGSALILVK
jgi:pilus assembly protein CpaE